MTGSRWFACLLGCALLVAACDSSATRPAVSGPTPRASPTGRSTRIIGLVGTLSGPDSWRGENAFEGADVAVNGLNRKLSDGEQRFELVTVDDRGDVARATDLVEELADGERTVGILYAGPQEGLSPTEPALARAGIPAVLCFGDLYGRGRLSPHVFQTSPSVGWEARRIASYLLRDRRYEAVGMVTSSAPSGRAARRALGSALIELGGRRPRSAEYSVEGEEPQIRLRDLRRERVEALVVEGSPTVFKRALDQLKARGSRYLTTDRARAASLPTIKRRRRAQNRPWRPQVIGFDQSLYPGVASAPGTVASDSYARGAHYLPIPSMEAFRADYERWWDEAPTGWEQRAYDAVHMLGWAARRGGRDLADSLEKMRSLRFGGLEITLGPRDHMALEASDVGLWAVPSPAARVSERGSLPSGLSWVPLARGFARPGGRTRVSPEDYRDLFSGRTGGRRPAPSFRRMAFGVTTGRSDPVH
ncbi:MAG: amino acid ABC transporter substrate-binding protein [Actinobacteria bacterium]|nr:amino acid ABC transporter substrate-binding protein [Actinomycetota bacterium]